MQVKVTVHSLYNCLLESQLCVVYKLQSVYPTHLYIYITFAFAFWAIARKEKTTSEFNWTYLQYVFNCKIIIRNNK